MMKTQHARLESTKPKYAQRILPLLWKYISNKMLVAWNNEVYETKICHELFVLFGRVCQIKIYGPEGKPKSSYLAL